MSDRKQIDARYRERNRERVNGNSLAWYEANRTAVNERRRARRNRTNGVQGLLSARWAA